MDHPELDEEDVEAIMQAAYDGDLEAVRRLVQQDRRLLEADDAVRTPLIAASDEGQVEVIRYLMDEGAQVNLRDPEGASALDVACCCGHLVAASLLLAHGADAAAADYDGIGWTPLMHASAFGHTDVVALLLAHGCGDIDRRSSNGRTALHRACGRGNVRVVRALLGAGADPHVVDHDNQTPLAMAVRRGREDCVAELQVSSVSSPMTPRMCVFCSDA
jgi:ankyrin repeat protein